MKGAVIKAVSEFAEVITGGTPSTIKSEYWNGDVPWLNSGSLNEGVITAPSKYITQLGLANSSAKLMPKDTVLVALTGATTGQVGYLAIEASANQSVTGILPSKEHHPKYLYFFFKSQRQKIISDAFGGAQPHINQKYIKNFKIPLPPVDDQIRISNLLGKVEGLIAQRKLCLQQLDELLKSVFMEMFGDPVRNEKGWDTGTSPIYAEMVTVGVVVKPASHYVERGVIALRSLNIKPNRIDLSDLVYFSQKSNDGVLSKSRLKANDVVVVRTGKTGTAAVVPPELDGTNCIDLIVVRPKRAKMHPQFLTCLLNSERGMALVASLEVGGIQKHFNVGALNKIPFPLPPIELQVQFADIVEKVESIKSSYQQSLTDLEALYGALSQQAFKGELDLSRVLIPTSMQVITPTKLDKQQIEKRPTDQVIALTEEPFNSTIFENYLRARAGKVYSTQSLWDDLKQAISDNSLPNFENFKEWILRYLTQGSWFEQVYENDPTKHKLNVDERRVCLRIKNDS